MKLKILSLILALITALTLFVSCSKNEESEKENNSEYEGEFQYNTFAGVVVSAGETKIEKNGAFEVSEIKVSVGDSVKTGDVLFVYDTQKATIDLERANLELEQLNSNLASLKTNKEKLEAEKATAPADQQLQYSLEIQEAEADILECEYSIKAKEKDIVTLKSTLETTEVTSPVDGTVTAINKEETDNYGQPQPYMVVTETGSMRVMGYVNESNISDITIGAPVTVKSRVDDATWQGSVSSIDLEKPEQTDQNDYYVYNDAGISVDSSSKYPFYVELEDSEGLMLGQHVYIITDSFISDAGEEFVYDGAFVEE